MAIELTDYQREALDKMHAAWREGRGVYLVGATGTGKTMLAEQFARTVVERRERKQGNQYVTDRLVLNCLEATLEAHASMSKGSEARSAWEMIQEAKTASVTVLDDVGRERGDYGRDLIFSLIDRAGGFLIITSNKDKRALAEVYGGDEGLRSRFSALETIEFPADAPNFRRAK
jgi:DNA replication protein DnaC